MKIIDKMQQSMDKGQTFFSFEFFPPRTEEGVANLYDRQDRMGAFGPTFCDITWGAGGSTADLTLDIAAKMQNLIGVETMMHLTCTNMPEEKLSDALSKLKEHGIQNVLALRGDPPKGQDSFVQVEGGFACALDLVKYIRQEHGDHFGVAVAGYPEAHPDAISQDAQEQDAAYWKDIHYLKEKVDAGGDFVVTQLFYDVDVFLKFVDDCRSVGITVPIIPGIMPIMTYGGFKRMTGFCKTKIPAEVSDALESIKDNDEAVKAYGVQQATDMCKRILAAGIPGLHLYTLNLERSAVAILENLEIIPRKVVRNLPWRKPTNGKRVGESVRPVFWANRPAAYVKRTADWDAFPSGRWGNAKSPAYGTLSDYQFMRRHTSNEQRLEKAKSAWGATLSSVEDVVDVFVKYTSGKINLLPWTELEGLQAESANIAPQLVDINRKGYLTINSQPQVNAALSSDSNVGWGGPDGYVYQKAYVEFFVSPEKFTSLQAAISKQTSLTYMAVTSKGDYKSNQASASVNAVTWGVFPGSEIVQPTVVDQESFLVWKDEAFSLWQTEWASLYDAGSTGHRIIQNIVDCWYLVSVVENDFIKGDVFRVFESS